MPDTDALGLGEEVVEGLRAHGIYRCSPRKWRGVLDWHAHVADALLPLIERREAEAAKRALLEAADDLDEFAADVYGEGIFRRPSSEDYAEINALLDRERGHQLDGVAADCYSHAIKVQAERLRDRADRLEP